MKSPKISAVKRKEYTHQLVAAWKKGPTVETQRKIEHLLLLINQPFLMAVAFRLVGPIDYHDLLNSLRLSLYPALRRYQFQRGCTFLSYWAWYIRCSSTKWWANDFGLIPKKHFKCGPGASEWEKKIRKNKKVDRVFSLDTLMEGGSPRMTFFPDKNTICYDEGTVHVNTLLNTPTLTREERDILQKRFVHRFPLETIASKYNCCKERIRQRIEDNALPKIKKYMKFQKSLFFKRFNVKY